MAKRDMQDRYIKSPMNYTGGKYKLLKQILPLFPTQIDTFVDLFAGGCNVAVNVAAKQIIANDSNREIIELYRYFQTTNSAEVIEEIERTIEAYGLSNTAKHGYSTYNTNSSAGVGKYNKEAYTKLRNDYNKNNTPLMFYITLIFAFNNQVRFNSKGEFNTPVNKRDFNNNMKKNLESFIDKINTIDIAFHAKDFREVQVTDDAFVYIDPPYLATLAAYNESGGWNEEKELELLEYMDALHAKEIKFALSNVFENKGNRNDLLLEWSKRYNVHHLDHTYSNCNYQAKDKSIDSTTEILITNY